MSNYHDPVLLEESVHQLMEDPTGIYVDVTFGGGGHARKILSKLDAKGQLVVFDQDIEAESNVLKDERLVFVKSNFRYLYRYWKWLGLSKADGIIADLGVSSHQFDTDYRGFSYRFDAELDMRMNENGEKTARSILSQYSAERLQEIFSKYGEIRNSKTLANAIVNYGKRGQEIISTFQLNDILDEVKVGSRNKYFSQVYQALRIEVNDEMRALEEMLLASLKILKPGGKLVVISYHSLEDRLVKRFLKSGNLDGILQKDAYGKSQSQIKASTKLIVPSDDEQENNVRSRSAKMRVGVRL